MPKHLVPEAQPGDPNFEPVDRYTLFHLGVGLGMSYLDIKLPTALAISIGWELLERPLKRYAPHIFPDASQDSPANAVSDAAANMVGWMAGEAFKHTERSKRTLQDLKSLNYSQRSW